MNVLERQAERGWLLPYLLALDIADGVGIAGMSKQELKARNLQPTAPQTFTGWRRWAYWLWIIEHDQLPDAPIPRIEFTNTPDRTDAKAIQDILSVLVGDGYAGVWYDEAWILFVKWLLHGFGRRGLEDEIARIPDDVKEQWYRRFNLANLLHSPCDWSAFVLQGGLQADKHKRSPWSQSTGFYATPMNVCMMMNEMTLGVSTDTDTRLLSVFDPCVGTGSMLLAASNYSLRLYGQDIVSDLCLCAELNGWLWMPWIVMVTPRAAELLGVDGRAPMGIELSDSPDTLRLAEKRRHSANAFYEAARTGKLEQQSFLD